MAKAKRIKALRKKVTKEKEKAFLKLINQDEPHFIFATVPGIGTVDLTNERRTA